MKSVLICEVSRLKMQEVFCIEITVEVSSFQGVLITVVPLYAI